MDERRPGSYRVINHGISTGLGSIECATSEECFRGEGNSASEALDAAIEQAAEAGWDVSGIDNECRAEPTVPKCVSDNAWERYAKQQMRRGKKPGVDFTRATFEEERLAECDGDDESDMYSWFVTLCMAEYRPGVDSSDDGPWFSGEEDDHDDDYFHRV